MVNAFGLDRLEWFLEPDARRILEAADCFPKTRLASLDYADRSRGNKFTGTALAVFTAIGSAMRLRRGTDGYSLIEGWRRYGLNRPNIQVDDLTGAEVLASGLLGKLPEYTVNNKLGWRVMELDGSDCDLYAMVQ